MSSNGAAQVTAGHSSPIRWFGLRIIRQGIEPAGSPLLKALFEEACVVGP